MALKEEKEKKNGKPVNKNNLRKGFFSGGWLTSDFIKQQRWYILLMFMLALFYISYRYYSERAIYERERLEDVVKALEVEYTIQAEELIRKNKRSDIIKQVNQKGLDLVESEEPPKRIKAN